MAERLNVPRNLSELAKGTGRWENEGVADKMTSNADFGHDIQAGDERILKGAGQKKMAPVSPIIADSSILPSIEAGNFPRQATPTSTRPFVRASHARYKLRPKPWLTSLIKPHRPWSRHWKDILQKTIIA